MIRVILPTHLHRLAGVGREIELPLDGAVSVAAVLDALEERYPMLRGTLRDQVTKARRPFVRFFAVGEDLSQDPPDNPLPDLVIRGIEPLRIVGAMAGG
jgi:sulfur-carrier protein